MTALVQKYPRSFSGRNYRNAFQSPVVEALGEEMDYLYVLANQTRQVRTRFLSEHIRLLCADWTINLAKLSWIYGYETSLRPEYPERGGTKDEDLESAIGYLLRVREFVDKVWKAAGERGPNRDDI